MRDSSLPSSRVLSQFRSASRRLRAEEFSASAWQSAYMELAWTFELLLRDILSAVGTTIEPRWTLGRMRDAVGRSRAIPPVLFHSLEILIEHRNVVAHAAVPSDARTSDFLADLEAVRILLLWYLVDFDRGPRLSRGEAESLLAEEPSKVPAAIYPRVVFLSYAKEDHTFAERIHSALRNRGHQPWLDKKDLIGGQDWKSEIQRAIRESDYFVALLSPRSVSKRGFFQREIRFALDVLGDIPPGRIFFIPVLIEQCEVPDVIGALQWVDLTRETDFAELFRAIEHA